MAAVAYPYQIGEYDVTVAQYCQFLNAKAANDPYGLWNSNMSTDASGGINRSGTAVHTATPLRADTKTTRRFTSRGTMRSVSPTG